jgi:hypothetical protein
MRIRSLLPFFVVLAACSSDPETPSAPNDAATNDTNPIEDVTFPVDDTDPTPEDTSTTPETATDTSTTPDGAGDGASEAAPDGARDTAVDGADPCGTENPKYSEIQALFNTGCNTGCHAAGAGGLTLTAASSHRQLVGVNSSSCGTPRKIRVVAGDVAKSYLVDKLEGAPGICNDRMPKNAPAWEKAKIDKVKAWICRGAKND